MQDSTSQYGGQAPLFSHSYQIIEHVVTYGRMPTAQKMLLIVIAQHANKKRGWEAWPDRETLAQETGLSPSAITEAVKGLNALGLIRITRNRLKHEVNHYWIQPEAIFALKSTESRLNDLRRTGKTLSGEPAERSPESRQGDTNRLDRTNDLEQASRSMSTSTSDAPVGAPAQAPPVSGRLKRQRQPDEIKLSIAETKRIIATIPASLYTNLRLLYMMATGQANGDKDSKAKAEAQFDRKVFATIRFRGIPQDPEFEGYSEADWTSIFWYATKRTLEGRWQDEFPEIRDPASYLNEVADHAHWADDAENYSEDALKAAIAAHNKGMARQ